MEKQLNKEALIKNMTQNLPMLRTALGLTQEELADKIGVSRSTVISIENKKRDMTWNTFLSLVLLFIKNPNTDKLLNVLEIYTDELNEFIKLR
jgi:DNA-binding XRE family transcriptional regulator